MANLVDGDITVSYLSNGTRYLTVTLLDSYKNFADSFIFYDGLYYKILDVNLKLVSYAKGDTVTFLMSKTGYLYDNLNETL